LVKEALIFNVKILSFRIPGSQKGKVKFPFFPFQLPFLSVKMADAVQEKVSELKLNGDATASKKQKKAKAKGNAAGSQSNRPLEVCLKSSLT
jgi:hypothetical protein